MTPTEQGYYWHTCNYSKDDDPWEIVWVTPETNEFFDMASDEPSFIDECISEPEIQSRFIGPLKSPEKP